MEASVGSQRKRERGQAKPNQPELSPIAKINAFESLEEPSLNPESAIPKSKHQ